MHVFERGSIISHQLVESRIGCGEAHRITVVGSTVADLAGSDHPHHVLTACNGGYRSPASQGFCVACDVRFDSVEFLGSAWCDPESCEHLIEDQENVVFVCEFANRFEVFFLRRNYSSASHHGLGDYCCEVVSVPLQDSLERGGIIPLRDNNGSRYSVGYSWIVRQFGGRLLETGDDRGRLDAEPDIVMVAMKVSFGLEDLVAASEGSCDADCLHRRLRACVGEAKHFFAWQGCLDLRGYLQ